MRTARDSHKLEASSVADILPAELAARRRGHFSKLLLDPRWACFHRLAGNTSSNRLPPVDTGRQSDYQRCSLACTEDLSRPMGAVGAPVPSRANRQLHGTLTPIAPRGPHATRRSASKRGARCPSSAGGRSWRATFSTTTRAVLSSPLSIWCRVDSGTCYLCAGPPIGSRRVVTAGQMVANF